MKIAVIGEKGGTGKTTFATNLAGWRARRRPDSKVVLIDADRQGSASYWVGERQEQDDVAQVDVLQKFGDGLGVTLSTIDHFYDDVILDIPPGDVPDQGIALNSVDRIIVPVQPGIFDMWTVTLMDSRVGEVLEDRPDLKVWFVLNRVPNHRGNIDSREAREAFKTHCDAVPLARFDVHDRVSVRRAAMSGRTVEEYEPLDERATDEMNQVYKLAFGDEDDDDETQS